MYKLHRHLLIKDIIDSTVKILVCSDGFNFEPILSEGKTAYTMIRNFKMIGEAAERIPTEIKESQPDNNRSQRNIRNAKVKMGMSSPFKSFEGTHRFAVLGSLVDNSIKYFQPKRCSRYFVYLPKGPRSEEP
jgi:hypothetical protein